MPSASCNFLLVFYFAEYPYQTESKRSKTFWRFFLPRRQLGSQGSSGGEACGAHKTPGRTRFPGAPRWVVGPTGVSTTTSQLYKYPNIPETLGERQKHNSSHLKFQNYDIQSKTLFWHPARGEHDQGGVHHPHWCSSYDA